jgi:hypothetical protein
MKTPSLAWPTSQRLYPLSMSLASRRQASRSTGVDPSCRSRLRWRDCGADGEEGEEKKERVSLNGRNGLHTGRRIGVCTAAPQRVRRVFVSWPSCICTGTRRDFAQMGSWLQWSMGNSYNGTVTRQEYDDEDDDDDDDDDDNGDDGNNKCPSTNDVPRVDFASIHAAQTTRPTSQPRIVSNGQGARVGGAIRLRLGR